MGAGSWNFNNWKQYASEKGTHVNTRTSKIEGTSKNDYYKRKSIHPDMMPHNVMRECIETDIHPDTYPVIIGIDVTGSMGDAATEVAKSVGAIMERLIDRIPGIQIMVMGIGDLLYDEAPIQIGQFEPDITIMKHIENIYFEGGGGGNGEESYTAAWYMGLYHTKLSCEERGQKGLIITIGDECLNYDLPQRVVALTGVLGAPEVGEIETAELWSKELYKLTSAKYDIYHIAIKDACYYHNQAAIERSVTAIMGSLSHYRTSDVATVDEVITDIIDEASLSRQKVSDVVPILETSNYETSWLDEVEKDEEMEEPYGYEAATQEETDEETCKITYINGIPVISW